MPQPLNLGKETRYPMYRGCVGRSERARKIPPTLGFDPGPSTRSKSLSRPHRLICTEKKNLLPLHPTSAVVQPEAQRLDQQGYHNLTFLEIGTNFCALFR